MLLTWLLILILDPCFGVYSHLILCTNEKFQYIFSFISSRALGLELRTR